MQRVFNAVMLTIGAVCACCLDAESFIPTGIIIIVEIYFAFYLYCRKEETNLDYDYDIAKERHGQWFAINKKTNVIIPGSYGSKKRAMRFAAKAMGIDTKTLIKIRRRTADGYKQQQKAR